MKNLLSPGVPATNGEMRECGADARLAVPGFHALSAAPDGSESEVNNQLFNNLKEFCQS